MRMVQIHFVRMKCLSEQFDAAAAWSDDGVKGCRRFLERVWKLQDMVVDGDEYSPELETKIHQTIKKSAVT